MTYRSLFDAVERTRDFQVFEGTLDAILNDIITVLRKRRKTTYDYGRLAFQTPRIIRALVDCKQENPGNLRLLDLLRAGIDTSLSVYGRYADPNTVNEVVGLRDRIAKTEGGPLERTVRQVPDDISLVASEPRFSQATARKLCELVGSEEEAMFLAIGHGGIGAGLDVVLRHEDMSGQRNLEFYPVRYSRTEHKGYADTTPCLTHAEIDYLRKEAAGKGVIVFDENHCTGKTVRTAARFISEEIAPNQDVKITYNVNTGIGGEWAGLWEDLQDAGRLAPKGLRSCGIPKGKKVDDHERGNTDPRPRSTRLVLEVSM